MNKTWQGTTQLDPIESLIGRVGVRVGTTVATDNVVFAPFAAASVWHDFSGDETATYTSCPNCINAATGVQVKDLLPPGLLRDLGKRRYPPEDWPESAIAEAILAHLELSAWQVVRRKQSEQPRRELHAVGVGDEGDVEMMLAGKSVLRSVRQHVAHHPAQRVARQHVISDVIGRHDGPVAFKNGRPHAGRPTRL